MTMILRLFLASDIGLSCFKALRPEVTWLPLGGEHMIQLAVLLGSSIVVAEFARVLVEMFGGGDNDPPVKPPAKPRQKSAKD